MKDVQCLVCCILCVLLSAQSILGTVTVPVGTRFTTKEVQYALSKEHGLYIASTCRHFQGHDVVVSLLLRDNQQWEVADGVVYFTVTNTSGLITSDTVLCNNGNKGSQPSPNCTVKNWQPADNLYIHTISGDVTGIPFTVVVEFFPPTRHRDVPHDESFSTFEETKTYRLSSVAKMHQLDRRITQTFKPFYANSNPVYLIQSVHLYADYRLSYRTSVELNMTFCPNPSIGKSYLIQSTVLGIGTQSTFNQYACKVSPCKIDTTAVFESNPNQLPLNILSLQTSTGDLNQLYILVRCWGGDYDPSEKTYVGKFRYAAEMTRY